MRQRRAVRAGSGIESAASVAPGDHHEGHEVAQDARLGRPLRERAGQQRTGRAPPGLNEHRQQRGPLPVAARLELDEPGRRRAGDRADRQALHGARREEPRRAVREREEQESDHRDAEPGCMFEASSRAMTAMLPVERFDARGT
jgi:hypothetical protein